MDDVMRTMVRLVVVGVAAAWSVPAFGYDVFLYPQNQTVLREQRGEIPTVFQDVRSPMITTMPGMGMYDVAQIRIGSTYSNAWWEGLTEEQRDQGRSLETTLLARLRVGRWCAFEVEAGVQDSQLADSIDLRNVDLRAAFTVHQARYTGLTVVLGAAAAVSSDGKVPGYNHENDFTRWAYLTEVRFTTNIGFNVISANIGGRWAPNVANQFEDGLFTEDGVPIAEGPETENNYVRLDARAGWSYRPLRLLRAGVEYQLKWENFEVGHFDPEQSGVDVTNVNHIGSVFVEFNPIRQFAVTGFGGVNFIRWDEGDHGDALVFGGAVQVTF